MALVRRKDRADGKRARLIVALGLFGAALLYGDGLITPAISVLSAVEGLQVAAPAFHAWIVPLSLIILIGLFRFQEYGTQKVGSIFGPIMVAWFVAIGLMGLCQIVKAPVVLAAFNPVCAVRYFVLHRFQGFVTMGTIFLCLTGGEALYADMGHFGLRPIRIGWYTLVMPTLLLNYFGQGAYLLRHLQDPAATDNLFYRLAPTWALYPMVALATLATIIASQAVISGAFSLTRQAMQLGYCPRLTIIHTSEETIGQVYMPEVNAALLLGTVILVLGFRNSDSLAGAYGLAVSLTMLLTTAMLTVFMVQQWHWSRVVAGLAVLPILAFDLTFFISNSLKIANGGWVGTIVALLMFTVMITWHRGRLMLGQKLSDESLPLSLFLADIAANKPPRVPGTAVFLSGNATAVPGTLLHNFKHNKILHRTIVLLTVQNEEVPRIPATERVSVERMEEGFTRIVARYGFSEDPNLRDLLRGLQIEGLDFDPMKVTFFLGRETLILGTVLNMRPWRKRLFAFLSRNARDASKFFHLPPNRVIEVGIQVEL